MALKSDGGAVMLWGMNPNAYERGTLMEQRPNATKGMFGFYNSETGLYLPSSFGEILGGVASRSCVGLHFGDGDYTTVGLVGVALTDRIAEATTADKEALDLLESHIGYQNGLPWPALYDHKMTEDEALQALAAHTRFRLLDGICNPEPQEASVTP